MNLKEEILKEHSKNQCSRITKWVGNDQSRFNELFGLVSGDNKIIAQRAAWPLAYSAIAFPGMMLPLFEQFILNLKRTNIHDSVKRNSLKILEHCEIPEAYHGEIMNMAFDFLAAPTEAIAVKAFALTVLGKLVKFYPEIIPEIRLLIEENNDSPAMRSRGKKFLKELK